MLRTKIVCTLGPATSDPDTIGHLILAGMNVARVNASHGTADEHRALIRAVRRAGELVERSVSILVDLQGPKIRVGRLTSPIPLEDNGEVVFAPSAEAGPDEIPTTYPQLAADVEPGDPVLLDDGLLELECVRTEGNRAVFKVIRGGLLKSGKGINIPSGALSTASITDKDLADVDLALEEGVEFIGLSFVREARDVAVLRERVGRRALIVAKIEMARALTELEEILKEADMVMVARGDLGVELPFERVPLAQKRIIQLANYHARPVITATQMLESMIDYPRPTRAEASDVANAVLDGTDAVMLSAETAVGKYPLHAVNALTRIIGEIESSGILEDGPRYLSVRHYGKRGGATPREHAVASAAVAAARDLRAPAILTVTKSGFSARLVSSHRPAVPIFAVTTDPATHRQLAAVWGVVPVLAETEDVNYDTLTDIGKRAIRGSGVGQPGDPILITAGFPFHQSGTTNAMRVEAI